ncbi:MAG TPA: hypothetical protein VK524_05750, partial [Polyangiaceae bacterium]|nr:hypothetical protein [Polyangiaceae bacterium]
RRLIEAWACALANTINCGVMAKRGLTVGSLLGMPQQGVSAAVQRPLAHVGAARSNRVRPAPSVTWSEGKHRAPAPFRLARGCCRSGCAGCPWAEAQRRSLQVLPRQNLSPASANAPASGNGSAFGTPLPTRQG